MNIKVGDTISYKKWGDLNPSEAVVEGIEICKAGTKYGRQVTRCDLSKHSEVVLDLSDDHWCYKEQVVDIIKQ